MSWNGHAAHMRQMKNTYNILVTKPERKTLLEGSRRRQKVKIKI
jgi:hypothetical protein